MTAMPDKASRAPACERPIVVESDLLAWVFEGMDAPGRINVLDIGPAMPGTIKFLNSTRCRMHVADLFDSAIIEQQHHLDQDALTDRFAEALWMIDEPLQACLLWDFPNYLTPAALEALNRALRPWVTDRTRAHAFCAVKRSAPLMQHQYDVISASEVVQTAALDRPPAEYPHPWRRMVRALDLFDIARGALRAGGRIEVILQGIAQRPAEPTLLTRENVKDFILRSFVSGEPLPPPAGRTGGPTRLSPQAKTPRAVGQ